MSKIAFVFAGQGAQTIGMGREISKEFKSSDMIFESASQALGFDLKKMVFEGDEETLKITENTQPAILTASIACLQPLLESKVIPDYVAGLSLGEYSALVCSEVLEFNDAVKLVRKRGKYMQEAVPLGVGTMAAIMGLENNVVVECCNSAKVDGVVEPANFNCPGQVVIAGEVNAVQRAMEIAKEKGAKRAMLLPVSAPFHCSLLKPAGEMLKAEMNHIEISNFKIPLVTNVTGDVLSDVTMVKDMLVRQVSSPVLWERSVETMISLGVDTFIEIGPGKTLSGFVKKVNKDVRTFNVENLESLHKTLNELVM